MGLSALRRHRGAAYLDNVVERRGPSTAELQELLEAERAKSAALARELEAERAKGVTVGAPSPATPMPTPPAAADETTSARSADRSRRR